MKTARIVGRAHSMQLAMVDLFHLLSTLNIDLGEEEWYAMITAYMARTIIRVNGRA